MTTQFNYQRYLASREWGLLKRQVRERSGGNCERKHLTPVVAKAVHHVTYERIGHEDLQDLLHVCHYCHEFLSGERNQDPVAEEADGLDWGNSPWATKIQAAQALLDYFTHDVEFPVNPLAYRNLREFLEAHADAYGYDPADLNTEAVQFLVNTPAYP